LLVNHDCGKVCIGKHLYDVLHNEIQTAHCGCWSNETKWGDMDRAELNFTLGFIYM